MKKKKGLGSNALKKSYECISVPSKKHSGSGNMVYTTLMEHQGKSTPV
jgi:hypothetical protein